MITREEYEALKPLMNDLVDEVAPRIIAIHGDAALALATLQALIAEVLTRLEYGHEAVMQLARSVISDLKS